MKIIDQLKYDANGLVTVVTQDAVTNEVLMVAFMNKEAVMKTIETGKACYYSRSRQKLWLKGETSGHFQEVKEIRIDCDADAVLLKVIQTDAACHDGYRSCFYRKYDKTNDVFTICGEKVFNPDDVYKK